MSIINHLRYDERSKTTTIYGLRNSTYKGKPLDFLESWTNTLGGGIMGSQSAFKRKLLIKQKIPVLVDPFRQIYFFPTLSPVNLDCIWVNASEIKSIKTKGLNTEVIFKDESSLILSNGRRSIKKQWMRCQTMEQLILHSKLLDSPYSYELRV
jgi:competence transcription factor ComK